MTTILVLAGILAAVAIVVGVVIWRFAVRWPSNRPPEESWRHVPPYQGGSIGGGMGGGGVG